MSIFSGKQIGTLLLNSKILRDVEESKESSEIKFKDDVMYQWKRNYHEINKTNSNTTTPGKIEFKIQNGDDHDGNKQKHGAKYTEAEVQQLLLGLKREQKDNLELMQKAHDEALFKLRGK